MSAISAVQAGPQQVRGDNARLERIREKFRSRKRNRARNRSCAREGRRASRSRHGGRDDCINEKAPREVYLAGGANPAATYSPGPGGQVPSAI